ncbi:hypothetical protein C8R45DRAFT_1074371 [Mycena sanguinolenta]|nr:hypothetical protein C8R45DRAFT_1074371 [Mycena sanguinolenta]
MWCYWEFFFRLILEKAANTVAGHLAAQAIDAAAGSRLCPNMNISSGVHNIYKEYIRRYEAEKLPFMKDYFNTELEGTLTNHAPSCQKYSCTSSGKPAIVVNDTRRTVCRGRIVIPGTIEHVQRRRRMLGRTVDSSSKTAEPMFRIRKVETVSYEETKTGGWCSIYANGSYPAIHHEQDISSHESSGFKGSKGKRVRSSWHKQQKEIIWRSCEKRLRGRGRVVMFGSHCLVEKLTFGLSSSCRAAEEGGGGARPEKGWPTYQSLDVQAFELALSSGLRIWAGPTRSCEYAEAQRSAPGITLVNHGFRGGKRNLSDTWRLFHSSVRREQK